MSRQWPWCQIVQLHSPNRRPYIKDRHFTNYQDPASFPTSQDSPTSQSLLDTTPIRGSLSRFRSNQHSSHRATSHWVPLPIMKTWRHFMRFPAKLMKTLRWNGNRRACRREPTATWSAATSAPTSARASPSSSTSTARPSSPCPATKTKASSPSTSKWAHKLVERTTFDGLEFFWKDLVHLLLSTVKLDEIV